MNDRENGDDCCLLAHAHETTDKLKCLVAPLFEACYEKAGKCKSNKYIYIPKDLFVYWTQDLTVVWVTTHSEPPLEVGPEDDDRANMSTIGGVGYSKEALLQNYLDEEGIKQM